MLSVPQLVMEVFLAMAMGGLIGLEREHTPERKYAGLRTLTLLAGVGPAVVAVSEQSGGPLVLGIYLGLAAAISLGILQIRLYIEGENLGFTTSVAVFISAVLGTLVGYGMYSQATALAVLSALVLEEKETLHGYVDQLRDEEIRSALQLGALGFILLPILPATAIDPYNALVPREIMMLGIFVLLIEFISYISLRQMSGSSGIYVTGILGGVASSFATTGVMASLASRTGNTDAASSGALISTSAMLVRDLGITLILVLPAVGYAAGKLSAIYIPLMAMIAVTGISAFFLYGSREEDVEMSIGSPFSIKSGLKFATVFAVASLASTAGPSFLGSTGAYATAFLGGLASSAAVVSSAATSYVSGSAGFTTASGMILSAIAGSMVAKIALIEVANRKLRRQVSLPLVLASIAGAVAYVAVQI